MNSRTCEVAYLLDRRIKKGTIYVTGHNTLRLITSGMGQWLRAQDAD